MDEKEIIKTDDPNIVIERTFIDTKIDIESIPPQIEGLNNLISGLKEKRQSFQSLKGLPKIAKEVVDKEVGSITGEIFTYEQELQRLNNFLNA